MLDEKFTLDQISIQHGFFIQHDFFRFLLFLCSVKPIQHFTQHGISAMLDEMLDRLNKAFTLLTNNI